MRRRRIGVNAVRRRRIGHIIISVPIGYAFAYFRAECQHSPVGGDYAWFRAECFGLDKLEESINEAFHLIAGVLTEGWEDSD